MGPQRETIGWGPRVEAQEWEPGVARVGPWGGRLVWDNGVRP